MEEFVAQAFRGRKPDLLEKLYAAALEAVGEPKSAVAEESAEGEYNSVALPEVPQSVVTVADADGEPGYKVLGQQVVADRRFVPPVEVAYVTHKARAAWEAAILAEIGKELAKG